MQDRSEGGTPSAAWEDSPAGGQRKEEDTPPAQRSRREVRVKRFMRGHGMAEMRIS